MLGAKTFYKTSSSMAPRPKPRAKRAGADTAVLPPSSPPSPPKRKRTTRQLAAPDSKPPARRSPRVASLNKMDSEGNTRRGRASRTIGQEENKEKENIKKESFSDEGDEETAGGLSSYEQRRLENISKNAEFFASLNIFQAKENLAALSPQAVKPKPLRRGLKSQGRTQEVLPRRAPSLRLQNKSPEGQELPEKFKEPPLYSLYLPQPREHERLPSGPITMEATNVKKVEKADAGADFVKGLSKLAAGTKTSMEVDNSDLDKFTQRLQRMKMNETSVAKVVPDRIFSVAVHPSVDRTIVCAGDKWGKVGFWDVNSSQGDDGVFLFAPHARPINCLQFAPHDPNRIYSTSYDGTLRCGDFTKAVFDEVMVTDEENDVWTSYFDFASSSGDTLLVVLNEGAGYVTVADTRTSNLTPESVYQVHHKRARTVSVHPTMHQYFVTTSIDCTAALWDIRAMKKSGINQPISKMPHSKAVSSAFFSPITGGKILTTSGDDKISIFDTESAKAGKLTGVKRALWQTHNNFTGRWLTKFMAAWHPRREDAFVVGSMVQPRRIEVFSDRGKIIHHFNSEFLGSVCSINVFHPSRDLMVGGNSSGKLHVFMA